MALLQRLELLRAPSGLIGPINLSSRSSSRMRPAAVMPSASTGLSAAIACRVRSRARAARSRRAASRRIRVSASSSSIRDDELSQLAQPLLGTVALAASALELGPDGARGFALAPAPLAEIAELGFDESQALADDDDQTARLRPGGGRARGGVARLRRVARRLGPSGLRSRRAAGAVPAGAARGPPARTSMSVRIAPTALARVLDVAAAGGHGAPTLEQLGLFGFVLRQQRLELADTRPLAADAFGQFVEARLERFDVAAERRLLALRPAVAFRMPRSPAVVVVEALLALRSARSQRAVSRSHERAPIAPTSRRSRARSALRRASSSATRVACAREPPSRQPAEPRRSPSRVTITASG